MNRELMFSNNDNSWATPQDFYNKLNEEFNFTLDPCATPYTAKCKKYYTKYDDGLSKSWKDEVVFCNPPYGREIKQWVKKCHDECKHATIVMLIPSRTDTIYFHDYIYNKAEIRFIKGRLKFVKAENKDEHIKFSPAPFPSMVVVFRRER